MGKPGQRGGEREAQLVKFSSDSLKAAQVKHVHADLMIFLLLVCIPIHLFASVAWSNPGKCKLYTYLRR